MRLSRLAWNIQFNLAGQILILVISFITVKLVFGRLGDDSLGIIYLAQALGELLYVILSLGLGATIVREIASHRESDPRYVQSLVRTVSAFFGTCYAVISVCWWFMVPLIVSHWLNPREISSSEATWALRIMGLSSFMLLPQYTGKSVLLGLQMMGTTNAMEVLTRLLRQCGIIMLLYYCSDLYYIAIWVLVVSTLSLIVHLFVAGQRLGFGNLMPVFSMDVISRNSAYALHSMGISAMASILRYADTVLVSRLLPLGVLGDWGSSSSAAWKSLLLADATSMAAFPELAHLHGQGERDGAKETLMRKFWRLQDLVCWGMPPISALFAFVSFPLFSFVFDPGVAHRLQIPLILLCLGVFMNATVNIPHQLAMATGHPEIPARFNFMALFVILPAMALLLYMVGLPGVGLAWILYHLLYWVIVIPRICRSCGGFEPWAFFVRLAKVSICMALTYGTGMMAILFSGTKSLTWCIVAWLAATFPFGAAFWILIGRELRTWILERAYEIFRPGEAS